MPRWPFGLDGRAVGISALIVVLLAYGFYATLRLRATYRLQTAAVLQQQQIADLTKDLALLRKETHQALAEMAETVYGPVTTTKRKPSVVEIWQRNRDKELRDRLRRLEQWRYQQER